MKTFEQRVTEANNVHNNLYSYKDMFRKDDGYYYLNIKCKIHGLFEKRVGNHIFKKQGCPDCSYYKRGFKQKITQEEFIIKANNFHKNKYDYSLVVYKNNRNKVKIICKTHRIFEQLPSNHYKQGCPKCCKNIKITNESFIIRAKSIHGNKYNYSKINYINITTPIKIICNIHGEFSQTPREHFSGCGCYKCSNRIISTEDFIEKANLRHNNLYDYSKCNYKSTRDKIIISCKIHGEFLQTPNDHLSGCGCQKCGLGNYSKICIEWLENIMKKDNIFIQHGYNFIEKKIKINNKMYKFDGYCEETNTVYEFYGDFWHGNPEIYKSESIHPLIKKTFGELYKETKTREKIITNEGYNLIIKWENDYKKTK